MKRYCLRINHKSDLSARLFAIACLALHKTVCHSVGKTKKQKNMHKKVIFTAAALAAIGTSAPVQRTHAEEVPALTAPEVRAMMRRFLLENGDVVMESIQRYQQAESLRRAQAVVRPNTPLMGDLNSSVTIIEFSDYECPFCRAVQPTVEKLRERYGSRVRFAYKHAPLDFHPKAPAASHAAMAAQEQGKFWEYSDALFAQQALLGDKLYVKIAKDLDLDMKKFNAYRASAEAKVRLKLDEADANTLGVRGTPFFLINGQVVNGAQPLEAFVSAIENAFKQTETAEK